MSIGGSNVSSPGKNDRRCFIGNIVACTTSVLNLETCDRIDLHCQSILVVTIADVVAQVLGVWAFVHQTLDLQSVSWRY